MVNITEVIGLILAGLGLFFIGIHMIGLNLRMMAGRGFRNFLGRITQNRWKSIITGVVAGGVTQSTSGVTFIMTGMVSAGLIKIEKAMPLVLWSNIGNCLLVFLAVINFHVMILYLLGIVGFLYYLDLDSSTILKPLIGVLLGIVLLFFGLDYTKLGADHLKDFEFVISFIEISSHSYFLGMLCAGAFAFLLQSAATVAAIATAIAYTGVLTLEGTLMIIYGSNLGPIISTWIWATKLSGAPKRLAVLQIIFRCTGLFILVPLFYLEIYGDVPLVAAMLRKMSSELDTQLALAYLLFQVMGVLILNTFLNSLDRLLEKLYPESRTEKLSKPQYINDESLKEPEIGLALAEMEQLRIVKRFPDYLDEVRAETESQPEESSRMLHSATVILGHEVEEYFQDLIKQRMSTSLVERALNFQNRMELFLGIEESLYDMVGAVSGQKLSVGLEHFKDSIIESTHMLMHAMVSLIEVGDAEDRTIIWKITEDRGDVMKKIHNIIRAMHPQMVLYEQQIFDTLSSRFERIVWMVRYINKLVEDLQH